MSQIFCAQHLRLLPKTRVSPLLHCSLGMASIHTAATFTFRQDLKSISGSASLIPLSLSLEIGTYFAFTRLCATGSFIWGHLTKTTAKSGRRPKCKKLKVSQLTELPRNSPPPHPQLLSYIPPPLPLR